MVWWSSAPLSGCYPSRMSYLSKFTRILRPILPELLSLSHRLAMLCFVLMFHAISSHLILICTWWNCSYDCFWWSWSPVEVDCQNYGKAYDQYVGVFMLICLIVSLNQRKMLCSFSGSCVRKLSKLFITLWPCISWCWLIVAWVIGWRLYSMKRLLQSFSFDDVTCYLFDMVRYWKIWCFLWCFLSVSLIGKILFRNFTFNCTSYHCLKRITNVNSVSGFGVLVALLSWWELEEV